MFAPLWLMKHAGAPEPSIISRRLVKSQSLTIGLSAAAGQTYTQKHFAGVQTIFDFATLTGACVTALGAYSAGVWSNDDATAAAVTPPLLH